MNRELFLAAIAVMMLLALPYTAADNDDGDSESGSSDSDSSDSDSSDSSGERSGDDSGRSVSSTQERTSVRNEVRERVEARDDRAEVRREVRTRVADNGDERELRTEVRERVRVRDEDNDEETGARNEARSRAVAQIGAREDVIERAAEARQELRQKKDELLESRAFSTIREEHREQISKLNPQHLETISQLRPDQVTKFRTVANERLRVLASENDDTLEKLARLHEADIEKIAKMDRARIKEFTNLPPADIQERLRKVKVLKAEVEDVDEFRLRPLALEHTQRAERALEQLRENEERLRERYEERKERLLEVRERVQACRENPGAENCANVDKEAVERAKEHALSMVERLLNHLEKVKERIESAEDLPEEQVNDNLARIEAVTEEVNAIKSEIEEAATKEEFNEAVGKLRGVVSSAKSVSASRAQTLIQAQTLGVIHRAEIMEKKLDCSLSSLEEQDVDTTELDAKVEEFSALIADARSRVENAKEAYDAETAESREQARALLAEARGLSREAQDKLKEVRQEAAELGGEACVEVEVAIDETDFKVEEETEVEVSGDVALSEEAQATLDELVASLEGMEGEVEMKLKIKKDGNLTAVERDEVEGELNEEQQGLWNSLKEQATTLVEDAAGEDAELEIEIEHELEIQAEDAEEEEGDSTEEDEAEDDTDEEDDADEEESGEETGNGETNTTAA